MKRSVLLFITLVLTFGLYIACPMKAEAAAVKLNQKKIVLEMDQTFDLELMDASGDVTWTSSNSRVVSVDEDGQLTPNAVGLAKVTAKSGKKKYTCQVTVVDYEGMSVEQKDVISYALQYVGNKYRYGGSSLTKGTDCSGFTMSVYKKFGYKLIHNSYSQLKQTKKVKMADILPGDLIFYGSSKTSCNHVALYIGNNKVVHASTEQTGITISDYVYRKTVGVGRVLKTATYPEDQQQKTDELLDPQADRTSRYATCR